MSLVRYRIQYQPLSADERAKLIEQIETVSDSGFLLSSDFRSGEFLLNSEDELSLINIPDGCLLTKL